MANAAAIYESNRAEIGMVAIAMNLLRDKLQTAQKEQRPSLLKEWWTLRARYNYLKWAIDTYWEKA
jgi:hypothetical protein